MMEIIPLEMVGRGLCKGKAKAIRLIQTGKVFVNGVRVSSIVQQVTEKDEITIS